MFHIALLGDSMFDNGVYVRPEPCVVEQVRAALADRGNATLCAVDGDCAGEVSAQLERAPAAATHVVVSAGGNDALGQLDLLQESSTSIGASLARLAAVQDRFATSYDAMLERVTARGLPTAVCTIYDPNFGDQPRQRIATMALTCFNDVIVRCAVRRGVSIVDVRTLFLDPRDYANPIEPSARGGAKLASVIVDAVVSGAMTRERCVVLAAR